MRRKTVKYGLELIIGGIFATILATFFHEQAAGLLFLSPGGETQFIFLGFFWGAVLGCCGILVTFVGFLRTAAGDPKVRLFPVIVVLIIVILLFFILVFVSFRNPEQPRLRPGETITI
jgi:hypothetical protein